MSTETRFIYFCPETQVARLFLSRRGSSGFGVLLQHGVSVDMWLQAELKAAHDKGVTVTGDLENARRQCKVHELEARDSITRAQKSEGDAKRAQQEAAQVTSTLDKFSAQCTALQQQLKASQASVPVCIASTSCSESKARLDND